MSNVETVLTNEEAEKIVNDDDYKNNFVDKEVKKIQDAQTKESVDNNVRGELFCPFCGKESLEVYLGSPFFFSCTECDKTIFMTDKKIFDDMNKELESVYKKEKEKAIEEALSQSNTKENKNE